MIVTRGGKEYQPSTDPTIIAPRQKDMSHAAFVLWETMIGLQLERHQAVAKWERIERFHDMLERRPDHSKRRAIRSRIAALESDVLAHQRAFLDYEEIARREWEGMNATSRFGQDVEQMYNTAAYQLPSLWSHPLGESSPSAPFPMSTTALQFASPALIRVYQGGKK